MRTTRRLLGALGLALAASAAAQPRAPDVPAGEARLEGRLEHAQRPEAVAGLEVLLYALSADGSAGLRETLSDESGAFRFEGISNDPGVVYLLGARTSDVPFGKRFRFEPGELEQRLVLTLSDPLADTSVARAGGVSVRLERGCSHLRVEHSHRVENPGDRVLFVPEAERAGSRPILEVEIPAEAEGFESLLGTAGLEREAGRVRFWGPLYPGEQELSFGYGQPLDREELALGFPHGASELQLLAPHGSLEVEAPELRGAAPGGPHQLWLAENLAPGASVELRVAAPERPESELRAARAEIWLELDDTLLDVNERLEVVAPEAMAAADAPLLCLPVPASASGLRFSDATLAAGLRRDPSGELALHGPLPAGSSQLALSYRLPATGERTRFVRHFDRPLELLSVLIADTGIVAETDRLHRRRPVRSDDRIYLHWEAFAVEAGERVELALRPTPHRPGSGPWASGAFAVLAGLASLGFLLAPLREAAPAPSERSDPTELERSAIGRALDDLAEDLETGKLDAEDHAALRSELEERAAAVQSRRPEAQPAGEPSAPAPCPSCRQPARAVDRFCSQCGAALPGASGEA